MAAATRTVVEQLQSCENQSRRVVERLREHERAGTITILWQPIFGVDKTREFIANKYYWPISCSNIEAYMKGYNVCLVSKTVRYKPYDNL